MYLPIKKKRERLLLRVTVDYFYTSLAIYSVVKNVNRAGTDFNKLFIQIKELFCRPYV